MLRRVQRPATKVVDQHSAIREEVGPTLRGNPAALVKEASFFTGLPPDFLYSQDDVVRSVGEVRRVDLLIARFINRRIEHPPVAHDVDTRALVKVDDHRAAQDFVLVQAGIDLTFDPDADQLTPARDLTAGRPDRTG